MTVYVSLLRGVNVGGSSRFKTGSLKALYESLGVSCVRTILQSGNVVFASRLRDRIMLARRIHQEIDRKLELKVDVIIRTLAELKSIAERAPALSPRADMSRLLVMFLAHVPEPEAQASLMAWYKSKQLEEMLEMRGPEIYLYYPNGIGRSKLTSAVIEGHLRTAGTARNWNTLQKLLEAGREIDEQAT